MTRENFEGSILVTASNKTGVGEFANLLHEKGYKVVSLGGTKRLIEDQGLPVTDALTFLGDWAPRLDSGLPERTSRGLVAARLITSLALERQQLREANYPVLDGAYINLLPPVSDKLPDTSGLQMLEAAINGSRHVMVDPAQAPVFLRNLSEVEGSAEYVVDHAYLAGTAIRYIGAYAAQAKAFDYVERFFGATA